MSTTSIKGAPYQPDTPGILQVGAAKPFYWLRLGWRDFVRTWSISLGYGVLFALLGWGLVNWGWQHQHLALTLTTGFMLISPFLAVVFYYLSRTLAQHHNPSDPGRFIYLLRRNGASIGLYAVFLVFALSVWERVSAILVGLFLQGDFIGGDYFSLANLFTLEQWPFVSAYFLAGAVLAGVIFALSVVSLPMMLDRRVDTVTAMITSVQVVRRNPGAMAVWAVLIASLMVVGFATWFIGLAVLFPLLGHTTWHVYRELVQRH